MLKDKKILAIIGTLIASTAAPHLGIPVETLTSELDTIIFAVVGLLGGGAAVIPLAKQKIRNAQKEVPKGYVSAGSAEAALTIERARSNEALATLTEAIKYAPTQPTSMTNDRDIIAKAIAENKSADDIMALLKAEHPEGHEGFAPRPDNPTAGMSSAERVQRSIDNSAIKQLHVEDGFQTNVEYVDDTLRASWGTRSLILRFTSKGKIDMAISKNGMDLQRKTREGDSPPVNFNLTTSEYGRGDYEVEVDGTHEDGTKLDFVRQFVIY